jgi:hypothetical protein
MKLSASVPAFTLSVLLALTAFAVQEDHGAPPAAKPVEQHALLANKVGVWDATMSGMGMESKAVYDCRKLGELWVVGDYKGDFMGAPFVGHEVWGFDSKKGKYVSTWVDNWSDRAMSFEGAYDAATKTLAMWTDGTNPMTGEPMRERHDSKFIDADNWEFTMNHPGPDGKYAPAMTIRYKRRK